MSTPPPPLPLHPLFQVCPFFLAKDLVPSKWLNFLKVLPPSPFIRGGRGLFSSNLLLIQNLNISAEIHLPIYKSIIPKCFTNKKWWTNMRQRQSRYQFGFIYMKKYSNKLENAKECYNFSLETMHTG